MPTLGDAALEAPERARVEAALARDPALADELELIAAQLTPLARRSFWWAFASECARRDRPATAVLPALVQAAGRVGT